jgi:hypothetical protein
VGDLFGRIGSVRDGSRNSRRRRIDGGSVPTPHDRWCVPIRTLPFPPERLPDGCLRLHETWTWTDGGEGSGVSIIEDVAAKT